MSDPIFNPEMQQLEENYLRRIQAENDERVKKLHPRLWMDYWDLKCECGGDKANSTHSSWCPKGQP